VLKSFYESPWDNIDFWYNMIFKNHKIAIYLQKNTRTGVKYFKKII
jgi:hypothetical protein